MLELGMGVLCISCLPLQVLQSGDEHLHHNFETEEGIRYLMFLNKDTDSFVY